MTTSMVRAGGAGAACAACTASSRGATWLWAGIFLLLAAGLAVLMVTEPAGVSVMLSTVSPAALVVAGTGASTVWFLRVPRRLGLRLCFAPV